MPSVDSLLLDPTVISLVEEFSREAVVGLTREFLEGLRKGIIDGADPPPFAEVVQGIYGEAIIAWQNDPRTVINATGVILHTNLGRAPLSSEATDAILQCSRGYSNLEYDLGLGGRGKRTGQLERLLIQLTGAEAAFVVNNNASAILLALATLAKGQEVIVSRGELVEIGGGFRIPDVLNESLADMVEVGTTNRTYIDDFDDAITERTSSILKIHSSNFQVVGFAHSPSLREMVELGREKGVLVLHDLGSGSLIDTGRFDLHSEPMPQTSISAGVDLVCFSGDKLLGGPQSGIILGKKAIVDRLKVHPLARALRIGKFGIAGLSATLLHYLKGEALSRVPVWNMISTGVDVLYERAGEVARKIGDGCRVVEGVSAIGGGSLPGDTLPTWLVAMDGDCFGGGGVVGFFDRLRRGKPPVIGRIENDRLLLDPRTVYPWDPDVLVRTVNCALGK